VYADRTAAWEGTDPERSGAPIRVEAGSYRGRPVYFHVTHPAWEPPPQAERAAHRITFTTDGPAETVLAVVVSGALAALLVLAVRNLRRGRGDVRGAARLAGTIVVLGLLTWLLGDGNVTVTVGYTRFIHFLGFGLTGGAVSAMGYLALEPVMRRRSPHLLTALARALDGRWRDPLVGRDVLIGVALGVASVVENAGYPFSLTDRGPIVLDPPSFTRPAWSLVIAVTASINATWALTSVFLVLSLVVRRDWVAAILLFGLLAALFVPAGLGSEWVMAGILLRLAAIVFLLLRFGVLALMAWFFAAVATVHLPLTLDPSAWYFGASLTKMLAVGGLAVYGFVASLGGRRLLREGFFGDD
jgi:serine/threonine-protein kinase